MGTVARGIINKVDRKGGRSPTKKDMAREKSDELSATRFPVDFCRKVISEVFQVTETKKTGDIEKYLLPELRGLQAPDVRVAFLAGAKFTPHIINKEDRVNKEAATSFTLEEGYKHLWNGNEGECNIYAYRDKQDTFVVARVSLGRLTDFFGGLYFCFRENSQSELGWSLLGVFGAFKGAFLKEPVNGEGQVEQLSQISTVLDLAKWSHIKTFGLKKLDQPDPANQEWLSLGDSRDTDEKLALNIPCDGNQNSTAPDQDASDGEDGYWGRYDEEGSEEEQEGPQNHQENRLHGLPEPEDEEEQADRYYQQYDKVETAVVGDTSGQKLRSRPSPAQVHTRDTLLSLWNLCSEEMSKQQFRQMIKQFVDDL